MARGEATRDAATRGETMREAPDGGGDAPPRAAAPEWAGGAASGEVPLSLVSSAVAGVRQAALQAPAGLLVAAESSGDARDS